MSDTRHDAQTPLPSHPVDLEPSGAGALLRQAREQAGLDVAALASMLKVPRARIESLEAGRFDELPDSVFARSLASSICRALRVDAAPVLALLPHANARILDSVAEHKATRIKSTGAGGRGKFSPSARANTHVSRRALALAAVFVLAAAAVILVPQGAFDRLRSALPAWGQASTPQDGRTVEIIKDSGGTRVVEEVSVPPAAEGTARPANAPDAGIVAGAGPATPASIAAPQATTAAGATAADATAVPATPAAADPPPAAGGGLLVISASAPTWIKVSDAKGAVLVQKTLNAGQVESLADAATPLSVVVGRTDTTTVQIRGEAFDLAARARNNVARFEVK